MTNDAADVRFRRAARDDLPAIVRLIRRIAATNPLLLDNAGEIFPGAGIDGDEELRSRE